MISLFALLTSLLAPAHARPTLGQPQLQARPDDAATGAGSSEPSKKSSLPRRTLHRIDVEGEGIGEGRSAYVWVPEGEGPFPVLFAIHGGKNRDGRDMVGKLLKAQRHDVILVYPNGGKVARGRGWVGPDKPEDVAEDRDVRYFRALVHTLEQRYPIQKDRMYVAGMSAGGYMTDLLWCEMSDTFAGFAVVSRAMPKVMAQTCDVARPRPYLLMLGTADDGLKNEYQLSFEDTKAFIRKQLGCPEQPVARRTLPDKGDPLEVTHTRWTCSQGVAFDDYEVEGGGHAWPGSGKPKPDKTVDVDATEVILEAFGL